MINQKGALFFGIAAAVFLVSYGLRLLPEGSPAARGAASANSHGCIECHGRSESGVPDDADLSCARAGVSATHRPYDGECSDVLAYFEVVRLKRNFTSRAKSANRNSLLRGEALARQYNCFQCHGEMGQGGFRNAGALKGYVPGYFGDDFKLLTQGGDTESVQAWIRHGIDSALFASPIEGSIAEYFIERQEVGMPAFGTLPDSTIRILADYVIALNEFGAMDAEALRAYGNLTQRGSPIGSGSEASNFGSRMSAHARIADRALEIQE